MNKKVSIDYHTQVRIFDKAYKYSRNLFAIIASLLVFNDLFISAESGLLLAIRRLLVENTNESYSEMSWSLIGFFVSFFIPLSIFIFIKFFNLLVTEKNYYLYNNNKSSSGVSIICILGNIFFLFILTFNSILPIIDLLTTSSSMSPILLNNNAYLTDPIQGLVGMFYQIVGIIAFNLFAFYNLKYLKHWQGILAGLVFFMYAYMLVLVVFYRS